MVATTSVINTLVFVACSRRSDGGLEQAMVFGGLIKRRLAFLFYFRNQESSKQYKLSILVSI